MDGLDFPDFLNNLNTLIREGFRLREKVYIEAIQIAQRYSRKNNKKPI
jgi:hypothetical protein